jgi:hypothetical protein
VFLYSIELRVRGFGGRLTGLWLAMGSVWANCARQAILPKNAEMGTCLGRSTASHPEERCVFRKQRMENAVIHFAVYLVSALSLGLNAAQADDGLGLKRGGNRDDVSISGVSSGAAMAVQYAVAHSMSIVGVGAIAGPAWGCADGRLSQAVNDCMCGRNALEPKLNTARELARVGKIDSLPSGKPKALKRSYIFHSPADNTVAKQSGEANAAFLTAFIGGSPTIDWGNIGDGSNQAGHGIIFSRQQ